MRIPAPPADRLPAGFTVALDPTTRRLGPALLIGGGPARLLRLSERAAALLAGRDEVVVRDGASAALARRLLDADHAHPRPAHPRPRGIAGPDQVTVVIPVRDRTAGCARLLTALGGEVEVIVVVDDGSADPAALAAVATAAGARLVRHERPLGPAAARNSGLRDVRTPYVAFVDSDCVPRRGWLPSLLAHLDDPLVALVAPRVAGLPGGTGALVAYEQARSSLDLGPREGPVGARGRIAYVPSAALLARRDALGDGFDESLRVAEDVDLVWRLAAAGWRVRYEPRAVVEHEHRDQLRTWAARKAFYGTGAAPLAARHPGHVPPLVMSPWTAATCALLLVPGRRLRPMTTAAALTVTAVATARLTRTLSGADRPRGEAVRLAGEGLVGAVLQLADAAGRHAVPLTLLAAACSPRVRRLALAAVVVSGLTDWRRQRPALDPLRYTALHGLDDGAYGVGLWAGVLRQRSAAALRPYLGSTR